ncbi:fluoride efflux transporter CrcB [uncultured Duncaniella sp.]|uniref:fluoride efflux transporter CrcB n=1 Tax=uncultured Duncaniella sp. TaxID=2768039 RepID=UPI002657D235|nr:fluoride efflux transporter CrcB [uncultured Duncaniella sp.]
MLRTILYIALGSGLGGVMRFLVSRWVQAFFGNAIFPWGTFAVNVIGCFIIGVIYGAVDRGCELSPEMKAFLTVGLCGGFTTFSTFMHENYLLFNSSESPTVALYAGASFTVGLLMAYAGHWCMKV